MDNIDKLLRNPFFLYQALLKVMPKTHDKEIYELQKALFAAVSINLKTRLFGQDKD